VEDHLAYLNDFLAKMAVFRLSKKVNLVKAWRCSFRYYGAVRSGGKTSRMNSEDE